MALHAVVLPKIEDVGKGKGKAEEEEDDRVALVAGYEDGRVELWTCALSALIERRVEWDGRKAQDKLWMRVWEGKVHNEAGEFRNSTREA